MFKGQGVKFLGYLMVRGSLGEGVEGLGWIRFRV